MRRSQQAFSAPSKQTQSSNAKDELSSTASINASSTTLIPSSELLASKPRDSTLKREQNSCYEHDNGLTHAEIPWAIATSGRMETARFLLDRLEIDCNRIPVVTRDEVKHAKPDPDLFRAAAARLRLKIGTATVIGDSVWDMLAARRAPRS